MYLATTTPTDTLIKCFYAVYNKLGYGFLEKVYERALLIELTNHGLIAHSQVPIKVYYDGELVGEYFADILVNDEVILELKTATSLIDEHEAQLLNYLKATDIEVGYLFNFGKKPEFKRKIFSNQYKKSA